MRNIHAWMLDRLTDYLKNAEVGVTARSRAPSPFRLVLASHAPTSGTIARRKI